MSIYNYICTVYRISAYLYLDLIGLSGHWNLFVFSFFVLDIFGF